MIFFPAFQNYYKDHPTWKCFANSTMLYKNNNHSQVLVVEVPATQEAEIRRIVDRSKLGQIVIETLS
jgi:hypothetical protein